MEIPENFKTIGLPTGPIQNLPPTIFGIPTQDALTVCAGLAMAAVGISRIINAKKH